MMRTIYLEGEMATRFGEKFEVFAVSAKDAICCLTANFSEFRTYLIDCHEKGVNFTCQLADSFIDEDEILLSYGEGDIVLTPVPAGSKGVVKLIVAAVLVFVALPYMAATYGMIGGTMGQAIIAGATGGFGGMLISLTAVSLAMQGLSEMMAPDPMTDRSEAQEESYIYSGTNQNGRIGDPIPIVYGRLRVPGSPIGSNIAGSANSGSSTGAGDENPQNTDSLAGGTTLTDANLIAVVAAS